MQDVEDAVYLVDPSIRASDSTRPDLHQGRRPHLCVRLDGLHESWDRLTTREADDYRDPASCDDTYAFTKDQDGHEIEPIEWDPGPDSLFPFCNRQRRVLEVDHLVTDDRICFRRIDCEHNQNR